MGERERERECCSERKPQDTAVIEFIDQIEEEEMRKLKKQRRCSQLTVRRSDSQKSARVVRPGSSGSDETPENPLPVIFILYIFLSLNLKKDFSSHLYLRLVLRII